MPKCKTYNLNAEMTSQCQVSVGGLDVSPCNELIIIKNSLARGRNMTLATPSATSSRAATEDSMSAAITDTGSQSHAANQSRTDVPNPMPRKIPGLDIFARFRAGAESDLFFGLSRVKDTLAHTHRHQSPMSTQTMTCQFPLNFALCYQFNSFLVQLLDLRFMVFEFPDP